MKRTVASLQMEVLLVLAIYVAFYVAMATLTVIALFVAVTR